MISEYFQDLRRGKSFLSIKKNLLNQRKGQSNYNAVKLRIYQTLVMLSKGSIMKIKIPKQYGMIHVTENVLCPEHINN